MPAAKSPLALAGGLRGGIPLLLCLLLLSVVWSQRGNGSFGVETDFYGCYAPQAKHLLETGTLEVDHFRGPLYPILLAATVAATPFDYFQSAFLLNLLSIVGLFWVLTRFHPPSPSPHPPSSVPLWLTLFSPVLLFAAVQAGTDLVFVFLTTAAVYFLHRHRFWAAGATIAAAMLTRSNGIALLLPALFMLWTARRARSAFILHPSSFAVLLPLSALLIWGLYTKSVTGDFLHNLNYLNTAALGLPNLDSFWYNTKVHPHGWAEVLSNPRVWHEINLQSPKVIWGILNLALLPLIPISLYNLIKHKQTLLLISLSALILPLFLVHWDTRTALPLLPLLALGLLFRSPSVHGGIKGGLLTLLLLANFAFGYTDLQELRKRDDGVELMVAKVADQLGPLNSTLCSRKPHIAWETGCHWVPLPYDQIFESCARDSVQYIHIGSFELQLRPQLRDLLKHGAFYPHYRISQSTAYYILLEYNPPPHYLP